MTNFDGKNLRFSIFKPAVTHYKTARVGITDIYYAISYWYLDPYVSAPNYGKLFHFIRRYTLLPGLLLIQKETFGFIYDAVSVRNM